MVPKAKKELLVKLLKEKKDENSRYNKQFIQRQEDRLVAEHPELKKLVTFS